MEKSGKTLTHPPNYVRAYSEALFAPVPLQRAACSRLSAELRAQLRAEVVAEVTAALREAQWTVL